MRFEEFALPHAPAFSKFVADLRTHDPVTFAACFGGLEVDDVPRLVRAFEAERLDWRPKARQVSRTRYLLLDEDGGVAGFAQLQFPLGEDVADNFWFVVPPARRGRGFGTQTLNRLLFEGARAGLARAAVSCRGDDAAARACIERNRGELRGDVGLRASFWLPLR